MPTRSGELSTGEVAERLGLRVETVPNIIRLGRSPGRPVRLSCRRRPCCWAARSASTLLIGARRPRRSTTPEVAVLHPGGGRFVWGQDSSYRSSN
jgi:hypothetical protein